MLCSNVRTWMRLTNLRVKSPSAEPKDFSFPSGSFNMKGCFLVTCAVTGTVARKGLILPTACVLGVIADVTAGAGFVTLAGTVETAVTTVFPLLAGFSTLSPAAASSFFSSASAAILRWICGALMAAASAIGGGVLMVAQCRIQYDSSIRSLARWNHRCGCMLAPTHAVIQQTWRHRIATAAYWRHRCCCMLAPTHASKNQTAKQFEIFQKIGGTIQYC
jgi:hypothetical protein